MRTDTTPRPTRSLAKLTCTPDANGYNTGDPTAINYFEWCQDHNKPLEVAPFGDVGGGGPATLPDPNILANGAWYGGSPYLGPDATVRAVGTTGTDSSLGHDRELARPTKPALPSCGTRTTSARSPPTIFSRAE